jgi:hypothetical protein
MGKKRARQPKVVPFPEPAKIPDVVRSDIVIRIGGQALRVDLTAKIRDITGAPQADLIQLEERTKKAE